MLLPAVFRRNAEAVSADGFRKARWRFNHKDQPGKEAQRVGGDMRCDIGPEEQRQGMVHQIDKQRSIDEIGHAAGLKIKQPVAQRKDHIHHPQAQQHGNDALGFIHPRIAAAVALI